MYRFTQEPQSPMDYEVANWFTSTHPRSRFRQNLMASRLVGDRRMNLLNRSLTIWSDAGASQSETIESPAALGALLTDTFRLALPATADEIWARLPA
jgi:N-hydroxyarylamine O-acetyltransferase